MTKMDIRTLRALEFDKILEHLASFCVSEAGREVCLSLRPSDDAATVRREQILAAQAGLWKERAAFSLPDFPDLRGVFAHLESPAADLDVEALWAVRAVLETVREVALAVARNAGLWPELHEAVHAVPLPEMTLTSLMRCVGEDGVLNDESSPELSRIRSELRSLHRNCLHKVRDFARRYNIGQYLQDDYMTLASDRYVLPLKADFKGRIQGVIHDYSNTGETCYFEPMFLIEQNNRLRELKREEREEERRVLGDLTRLVRLELPFVTAAWKLAVRLDALCARSGLAAAFNGMYVTVEQGEDASLSLLEARHPLLALDAQLRLAGGPRPLDVLMRPEDRVLVISGGNAGGKTVCLKTLGLAVAMTLAGLPVPVAGGSVMPWRPRLLAFIGDEQSLDDHVSTFTAQIRYLGEAWEHLDSGALVLLDEFGAGTDPAQGAALAQAVLDGLAERGVRVAAATHFPALKTYALSREHVRAASMLFDPTDKRPLFKLAYDQVGASLALDVAREHGLPETVLRRAEQYLLLDGQDMSAVLDRLNALAAEREREAAALRAEQVKTREKRERYRERFERERERLQKNVQTVAAELTAAWKAERISAKQALRRLAEVRAELGENAAAEPPKPVFDARDLQPGRRVLHRPWGKEAVVREVDLRQNRARLDMNGVTLWADLALLGEVTSESAQRSAGGSGVTVRTAPQESSLLRLDLRGKRADLALSELSRYLDRALLSGTAGVEIIHGRGTGVLRKEVHAFLRTFPGIASFTLAPEDRGGDGVTVATFR